MDQDDLMFYGLLALALVCVIAIVYLLLAPFMTGERRAEKRLQGVSDTARGARPGVRAVNGNDAATNRKRQVADTIRDLEAQQKAKAKVSLRQMMQRAGLTADPKMFWVASLATGVVLTVMTLILAPALPFYVSIIVGLVGCLGLPRWFLGRMVTKRYNKFLDEFANAIDVIVRGVKSGLPLNECLNIIAKESPEPIASEFREVCEQSRVGVPLAECFERLMQRVPLAEVRFFSIVIGIQQQAGGNLSEALGNLSGVLRDRKRLASKVKALSAEAKASAGVLGSLPPMVMILVYITTPQYISLLWQKNMGIFMLLVAAAWMCIGILVMRKMINFKY